MNIMVSYTHQYLSRTETNLMLAYDPDYTKLLSDERQELDAAIADLKAKKIFSDDSTIDW